MTKINQILAIEKGVKSKFDRNQTELYRSLGQPVLLAGISRTYEPKAEDGDRLPAESTRVQVSVETILAELAATSQRLFDVTLTKETANTEAKADVVVDGQTLVAGAPVTYLLFLEKRLIDLNTIISKLPVLDPAQEWSLDENTGVYKSAPVSTVRNKKVPKVIQLAPPTKEHKEQVELVHEDVLAGTWTKVDYSGAIPAVRKAQLQERVDKLTNAVKYAREEANNTEIRVDLSAAKEIFSYLLS